MSRRGTLAVLLVLAITMLAPVATAGSPAWRPNAADPAVAATVADVSLERIYTDIYALQNFSTRYYLSTAITAASQYIYDRFAAVPGLQVSFQDFDAGGTPARNVIAVLPGTDPTNHTLYVFGAHYDSTSSNSNPRVLAPGADDDASGTAAVLEAARVLSRYRPNRTLVFAAWSAEEAGLIGSTFYCSCLASGSGEVGLNVNLDMIGYDPTDAGGLDVIYDLPSEWAADRFVTAVGDYGLGLVPTKVYSMAGNSDHASFWAQGYPAIMLIESDFSPVYHSSSDTVASVNMRFVTKTAQGAIALVASLVGIRDPSLGEVAFDRPEYGLDGVAGITVYDSDLNTNAALVETATVLVSSPQEPAGESVVLTETEADTGVFHGTLPLGTAPSVAGELQVAAGATITAAYAEASPAGIRTDTATIDGTFPAIRNVVAVPGVATATVLWDATEPTDATVEYGTTPALGTVVHDARPATTHRVALEDLQPDTTYYFDVRSTDLAGQTAVADNSGAHFAFHTLTGLVAIPAAGHAGYVRSTDPLLNYFDTNRMLSGYSSIRGAIYYGAAQFDTTAATIPAAGVVTGAWLDLYGQQWVYTEPGQWQVRYLNESIDPGWTGHVYAAIAGAAADFPIPPTLANADLVTGTWLTLTLPAAQHEAVKYRVNTGAVSIRIDGPTSGLGSIFDWATGYGAPCPGTPARYPRFTVAYASTGDLAGPQVTALAANPNPTVAAGTTRLAATVSDAATGGTPIAGAEFFVGGDPGPGMGTPMGAVDGAFDAVTEDAAHVLDVSAMPRAIYTVGVRARDRAGNWGPARTLDLYVGDFAPPTISDVRPEPPLAELGLGTTLGASVTDDVRVAGVSYNVSDSLGSPVGNFTAAYNATSGRWELARAYAAGTYAFTVWAWDDAPNYASATGGFAVGTGAPPQAEAGPDQEIERGRNATLDGTESSDDVGIVQWKWTVTGMGGTWTFTTSVADFTPPAAGTYNVTLEVWDAAGRRGTDTAVITVVEPAPIGWNVADWWWLILIVLAIVIVLVVVAVRRRKKEKPGSTTPP